MRRIVFLLAFFVSLLQAQIPDSCYTGAVFINNGLPVKSIGQPVIVKIFNSAYQNFANYWADSVCSEYHRLNDNMPELEWTGTVKPYLYDQLRDINGYYFNHYGALGLNKWTAEWLYVFRFTSNLTTRSSEPYLTYFPRWDIDGVIYNQCKIPTHTKTGDGWIILTSEDWNFTTFVLGANPFTGSVPQFVLPDAIVYSIVSCGFSNTYDFNYPLCTSFTNRSNSFSGVFNPTLSANYTIVQFYLNDYTSTTLYPNTKTATYNGHSNNFNQTAMDNFLCGWHTQLTDGSHNPTVNITVTMNNTGMATPSSTGQTCATDIQNFYTTFSKTAIILTN